MVRFIFLFTVQFLLFAALHAEDFDDTPIGLSLGYRYDNFEQRTHSKLLGANYARKQSFKNITVVTYGANFATYNEYNVFIRGKFNYGQVLHFKGSVRAPVMDFLHLKHNHDPRGNTYEGELAVGFPIWIRCQDFHFIPLVGYSSDRLKLRIRDHIEIERGVPTCFRGNIRNRITIQGPFVGLDFIYQCCWWRFYSSYELQWGHMKSICHYHMPEQFVYRASNRCYHGFGNTILVALGWQFATEWEVVFGMRYKNWHCSAGHHESVFKTADNTTRARARVKNTDWNSWGATLDLVLRY